MEGNGEKREWIAREYVACDFNVDMKVFDCEW